MKYRLIIENQNVEVENPELSQIQILLNKTYEALENPTLYYSEFSRSINVPFSAINNRLFSNLFKTDSVLTNKTIDPRKKLNFVLLYDNEVITKGYAKLSNIYDDQKNKYYVLNLFSSLGYILNEIKQLTFVTNTDIDKKYVIENPLSDNLVINKQLVKEAFEKNDYQVDINKKGDLDYFTLFPQYQGKYSTFSSDKMEIGGTIYDLGTSFDEHETRQFKSYMQGVGVWVNAIIQLIKHKIESISDYKIVLSKDWFNLSNPFWTDLLYTVPTLYKEDSENVENVKKEKYKIYQNQYVYNILNLSDLSNSHKKILPFTRSSGEYLYNAETKVFNMYSGSSCHFHEQLNYTLFIADLQDSIIPGYCRIKDDNALYLTIKAVDAFSGKDITGASTTYMFYSDENDRLNLGGYDHAIDIGITSREYPNAITNPGNGYTKQTGFYWQGDLVADFEVRTQKPFVIVADIRAANNSKLTERAISDIIPKWDWLWVDNWQSSNIMGATNGLTFFITCVNAEVENSINVRSNSLLTMERIWNSEETIYDVFMKYLKQFHLMMDLDEENKTITICTKERYFQNYSVLDWSKNLDRTKNFSVQNIYFDTKYLLFGYNNASGQRYDYYQKKYNTSYGRYRVDTGYEFNNNEKLLIEDLQPSMICTKKQSSIHNNTRNPEEPNFKGYSWKHYPVECFIENDANGAIANNYGSFYFFCGTYSPDNVLSATDNTNKPYITISDDTEIEIKQNSYCWNNSNTVKCYSFPLLSTYDKTGKYSIQFAEPKELYFNPQIVPYNNPKYLYNLFWERYLNEIYNIQNKLITAYIYITPQQYSNFKFNQFIVLDSVLYRVVVIKDYDISSNGSTQVQLLQVADITAYTKNNFDLPYLFTDNNSFTVDEKTTIVEEVFSNTGEWRISDSSTWINCFKQDNYLHINNVIPSRRSRLGFITLKNNDGITYTINIFQRAIESFLSVDKNTITFERTGGTSRIGVETYPEDITVVDKPDWVHVQVNKNIFGIVLVISGDNNSSRFGRSGYITITNGYNTATIRIAQQGNTNITTTTTTGDIITNKPIVIERDTTTTVITTVNKPVNPNTIVVSKDTTPLKPAINIGDLQLKITPKTTEESDGGRLKIYTVDGKPIIIDFNVGKVDNRYTVYIQGKCIVNGEIYNTFYEDILEGTELNIEAVVPEKNIFLKWSDEDININRTIVVNSDINIYPIFTEEEEDNNVYEYDNYLDIKYDNNQEINL